MPLRRFRRFLPTVLTRRLVGRRERRSLAGVPRQACDPAALRPRRDLDLAAAWNSPAAQAAWQAVSLRLATCGIPDGTGGVNPGDRRAVFYLVRHLRPRAVLEIGTHIGASTVHAAAALADEGEGGPAELVSVDIADVNDPRRRPWEQYGMRLAPRELMAAMGVQDRVRFVTRPSLEFLTESGPAFDFIFLDGDHAAATVYREVPAAVRALRPGGVILLHDYFPDLRPLWPDGSVIPGPFLAVSRLRQEGAAVCVVPLGRLPWPTKQQSYHTSLALLLREG